jgi:hypothetical protein
VLTLIELISSGPVTLGASSLLNVSDIGSTPMTSGTFVLVNAAGGITGAFSNIAPGTTETVGNNAYTVNYGSGGDELTLTVSATPEPGSFGLLALAGIGLLKRRRRHAAGKI